MNPEIIPWLFPVLLFAVAFLYASVGHGGASGYLALMAIFGMAPAIMKSSALMMNVVVSLISFLHYYRHGHFRWKIFLPFAAASVPLSFIGAMLPLGDQTYKMILGALLLFPVFRLFGFLGKEQEDIRPVNHPMAWTLGASIGLFSGMIGIGGGIILSPVLLLMRWATLKETAAISALFIFLNSLSGLGGMMITGIQVDMAVYGWIAFTLAGGFIGAYFGSARFQNPVLRKVLGAVLLLASIKLLIPPDRD